jgi:phosphatidylglycerophosphate synthase
MAHLSPDALSWAAFVLAVAAGLMLYFGEPPILVLMAFVFISGNALFDALDGKLARIAGTASRRGDFLDHVLDRYADVFIIGGVMLGPLSDDLLGLLALLGVIFTSYMGTQAQAVGVGRDYGGIAGRADRLAILMVATLLQFILMALGGMRIGVEPYFSLTILEYAMVIFAVAGHVTALQRARSTWRKL